MKTAIRYYSRFGHSKKMAEVIAGIAGAKPETFAVPLDGDVDILFLGAGVFLGKVDKSVSSFMDNLDPAKVRCVVLFGSSAIIDSPVPQMRKKLEEKGIKVAPQSFSCKGSMGPVQAGHPDAKDFENLKSFVKNVLGQSFAE